MQQNFYNSFCITKTENDFAKNAAAGVKRLDCLCENAEFSAAMFKKYGFLGRLILPAKVALNQKSLLAAQELGYPISILVDLLDDEQTINRVAMLGLPTTVILYENLTRTGEISQKYGGKMPAEVLEDLGFLDRECTIVGGMYADKEDLQILGDYSARIVMCPRAFAEKGGTFANLKLLKKYDIKLSLGTFDFEEIDFLKEIEFLRLTNCALHEDCRAVDEKDLLKLAQGENL